MGVQLRISVMDDAEIPVHIPFDEQHYWQGQCNYLHRAYAVSVFYECQYSVS